MCSECGDAYGNARGESDLFTLGICLIPNVIYDYTLSVALIGAVKRITCAVKQAKIRCVSPKAQHLSYDARHKFKLFSKSEIMRN